jgi:CheY-like chemotaxis protein
VRRSEDLVEIQPDESTKAVLLDHLQRVTSSRRFRLSHRLSRFLHFAVHEALEGNRERLKEYVIGVEVFQRTEAFDPRVDSIVRVEAGRLRTKLLMYYRTEGREDEVRIHFNRGSYVPRFYRCSPIPAQRNEAARDSRRVLIVGEDRLFCRDMATGLESAGFEAIIATHEMAVARMAEQEPRVELDAGLSPDFDNIENTCNRLQVPLVRVTGYDASVPQDAGTLGSRGYLLKPFAGVDLGSIVQMALANEPTVMGTVA